MWTNVLLIFKVVALLIYSMSKNSTWMFITCKSLFLLFIIISTWRNDKILYKIFAILHIFLRYLNNCLDIHVQCFRKWLYVGTDKTTLWLVPSIICIQTHLARKSRIHPYFKKVWIPCVCCVYSNGTALIIQWEISNIFSKKTIK